MKHLLRQVFRSGKFVVGFVIFTTIVLTVLIYPLFVKTPPLKTLSRGTFLPPGVYVNVYDSMDFSTHYTLLLDEAATRRIASQLSHEDRLAMREWLVARGIPEADIDIEDTAKLLELWKNNFDPAARIPGMTNADRNYYIRLTKSLDGLLATEGATVAVQNPETGALEQKNVIEQTDYVNVGEVPNVRVLPLGTDNFGRDVLTELVKATGVSLTVGFVAGTIATAIGLFLGLVSGYMGGLIDDFIVFLNNLFTVIPPIMLAILIAFSIGQNQRGAFTVAVVIGTDLLALDFQGGACTGDFTPQPGSCQPVKTIRALCLPHPFDRYSALHCFLCCHGTDPANLGWHPG